MNAPIHIGSAEYDVTVPREDAVLLCARIVHCAVEAMNKAHNEATIPWEKNVVSLTAGVERVLANPNETPEQNHRAWMEFRAGEGWVYGPIKDADKKTHPCMVPYEALGPFQKSKDAIFQAIVRTFFGLADPAEVAGPAPERPETFDAPEALAELDAYVTANFRTRYGAMRHTIDGTPTGAPYLTFRFGAIVDGDKNWWPELCDRMKAVFARYSAEGAVEIVWRLSSRFQAGVGDGYERNERVAMIRTRFAALREDGSEVKIAAEDELVKDQLEGVELVRVDK